MEKMTFLEEIDDSHNDQAFMKKCLRYISEYWLEKLPPHLCHRPPDEFWIWERYDYWVLSEQLFSDILSLLMHQSKLTRDMSASFFNIWNIKIPRPFLWSRNINWNVNWFSNVDSWSTDMLNSLYTYICKRNPELYEINSEWGKYKKFHILWWVVSWFWITDINYFVNDCDCSSINVSKKYRKKIRKIQRNLWVKFQWAISPESLTLYMNNPDKIIPTVDNENSSSSFIPIKVFVFLERTKESLKSILK